MATTGSDPKAMPTVDPAMDRLCIAWLDSFLIVEQCPVKIGYQYANILFIFHDSIKPQNVSSNHMDHDYCWIKKMRQAYRLSHEVDRMIKRN